MILTNTLNILTPLLLIATGGIITDIGGSLNIALEGLVTVSTLFSIMGAHLTGNLLLGTLIGMISSMILAALLSFFTSKLKANIFITGLAVNLFASGITTIITFYTYGTRGVVTFDNIKSLNKINIPYVGDVTVFFFISIVLLLLTYIFIAKTPIGLRIRACGMNATVLKSYGISRSRIKLISFTLSGMFCGLAGAFLSMNLGSYVPGMTAGKGWIALVIIYLAGSKIKYLFISTFIFAVFEAFSIYLQGITKIPADILLTLPSIFTLIIMILVSIVINKKQSIER